MSLLNWEEGRLGGEGGEGGAHRRPPAAWAVLEHASEAGQEAGNSGGSAR